MKFLLLAVFAQTAAAFSGGYLSQLNGGNAANGAVINGVNGANGVIDVNGSGPAFVPHQVLTESGPSQELLDLISHQVSVELMASQAYMQASIWFRAREMDGMAAWMLDESDEERGHGKQILEFAMKCQFPVTLEPLAAPTSVWQSPEQVWAEILALEQNNTRNLLAIAAAANRCEQFGVMAFLDPFHVEQIEAEDKVGGILAKVTYASEGLLWQLDHELGMSLETHS